MSISIVKLIFYVFAAGALFMTNPVPTSAQERVVKKQIVDRIEQIRKTTRIHAPEFPSNFEWLNIKGKLSLKELRGKIVLLDFWTYCCINCMHVIPDLLYLEEKYKDDAFIVLGVHSAKFTNEQDKLNIRQAILRYDIPHPIVVDEDHRIWQEYEIRAWPSMMMVDPEGFIIARIEGEGNREILDDYITAALDIYGKEGKLDNTPVEITPEIRTDNSPLFYPGKVISDSDNGLLYIADSNNNRILVTDKEGIVIHIIGEGSAGFKDGTFEIAEFNHPLGMALVNGKLLIADNENHAIREVNFLTRKVETIAGTGVQGRRINQNGKALETPLNSPWDLYYYDNYLYVAMAGPHQITRLSLDSGIIEPFAGSGREERRDGAANQAGFAQPSGLTSDGKNLYVADSEISAVRSITLSESPTVSTLAGGDLFDFGDIDGEGDKARLQHPLGVYYHEGIVYLADTYNHKIKKINPETGEVTSYAGNGKPGFKDGKKAQFYEPSGMTILDGVMYIADTNNHRIRTLDLESGEVGSLEIKMSDDIPGKDENYRPGKLSSLYPGTESIILPQQTIKMGTDYKIEVRIELPEGTKFNEGSPFEYAFSFSNGNFESAEENEMHFLKESMNDIEISFNSIKKTVGKEKGELIFELAYYYCETEDVSVCRIRSAQYTVPFGISSGGSDVLTIVDKPGKESE